MPEPLPTSFPFVPSIIFTDIDDTLTWKGKLPPETFQALNLLKERDIPVIPVTGASCGWCDCIARTWPIDTIIGENGALVISTQEKHSVDFVHPNVARKEYLEKLEALSAQVLSEVPGAKHTHDTQYRITDIAFDIGQDQVLPEEQIRKIVTICEEHGATARVSSIHINVWFGGHTKASTSLSVLEKSGVASSKAMFIGDSPNDEDMFCRLDQTVGVANIKPFLEQLKCKPAYITTKSGGMGFAEFARAILAY